VRPTDPPITREHAYALAVEQLRREYLPAVLRLCPGIDSYDRLAGVLSFTYNVGAGALQASTLRRRINAGDWPGAQTEMRRWIRGGGRVLPGLVTRRAIEAGMLA
jgi:lysozyme